MLESPKQRYSDEKDIIKSVGKDYYLISLQKSCFHARSEFTKVVQEVLTDNSIHISKPFPVH